MDTRSVDYRGHALSGKTTTLPSELYTSQAVLERERERIFARRWLCVGRGATLAEPGDYRLVQVGLESLIVVRGADRTLRALLNVCRHRGTRLCTQTEGRLGSVIVCPYHAWTYELDGTLRSAPTMKEAPWFDPAEHSLVRAAAAEWEGFLFVNLAADPEPLSTALRPLLGKFAAWGLPELVSARRTGYDVAANWKLLFQNFSECDHCPPVHPTLARLSDFRSGANDLREGPILGGYMLVNAPGGSMTLSGRLCGAPPEGLADSERVRVYYYSVFPTFFLTVQADLVLATHLTALSVDKTRVECDWLVSPETAASDAWNPSDGIDFWDRTNQEDWRVCELAQQGVSSRAYIPGPYSTRESLLAAFDREYLTALESPA